MRHKAHHIAPGLTDYGLLMLLACVWGGSFMLIKVALEDFGPASLTAWRLLGATIILVVAALVVGDRFAFSQRDIVTLVLVGLFGNSLPFLLISWGEVHIDASLTSVLMGIMPIATLVLAHFFAHGEPLTRRKLLGVAIGFAGLVVLVGPSALSHIGEGVIAQFAILAAALSYGVNAVLSKRLLHLPRRAAAAGIIGSATLQAFIVVFLFENPFPEAPGIKSLTALFLLAVFPTALAALVAFEVLARQGAGFFGQVNLLVPPVGVAIAFVFLGEVPEPRALIALAFILFGIAVARGATPAAPVVPIPSTRENLP